MNERILELSLKAAYDVDLEDPKFFQKYSEKFAKLIVRECIRVPYDMWDKAELNADMAVKIEHRIREHFGVEE